MNFAGYSNRAKSSADDESVDTIRYDTIRYGRLTCAQKLTRWPA